METEWSLYDLETEDEFKFSGDLVHFKNSGLSFSTNDFKVFLDLHEESNVETKKFIKEDDDKVYDETYLDEVDYTYLESENGEMNYVIHLENGGFEITVLTKSGKFVNSLAFSSDAIQELRP